ncbi:MAG: DinB family protein [Acidimicrobiales bacterium]
MTADGSLRAGRPAIASGRHERVEHDGYAAQQPADVARELVDAARLFANVLSRIAPEEWGATVIYNHPEPSERSLRWVAVYTLHEVRHHLLDIRRQLR